MADITASGKVKVKTLKAQFKAAYGVEIRVYNGARFADDNATLASIRTDKKEGEIKIHGKMLIANIEKKFLEVLGVKVRIESKDGDLADKAVSLGSLSK